MLQMNKFKVFFQPLNKPSADCQCVDWLIFIESSRLFQTAQTSKTELCFDYIWFDWSNFTKYWRIFHINNDGQHCVARKPGIYRKKNTTIHRFLGDLLAYCGRGSQHESTETALVRDFWLIARKPSLQLLLSTATCDPTVKCSGNCPVRHHCWYVVTSINSEFVSNAIIAAVALRLTPRIERNMELTDQN